MTYDTTNEGDHCIKRRVACFRQVSRVTENYLRRTVIKSAWRIIVSIHTIHFFLNLFNNNIA